MAVESEEEWHATCSDDDNYGFTQHGNEWLPSTEEIVELYGKLSKGEKLELEWKCVAKRAPTPEVDDASGSDVKEEEMTTEENKHEVTEFDFDDAEFDANPITPKRTPASAKPAKSQKRVARLDKIMDDMFRHKKLNAGAKSGLAAGTAQQDRILQDVTIYSKSPRGSPKASPRPSPKAAVGFSSPRGSPRPYTGSPKPSSVQHAETPQRDSPKNRMSPKRLA